MKTHERHMSTAPKTLNFAIVIVSTSRTREATKDVTGELLRSEIERSGHKVSLKKIVGDRREEILDALKECLVADADVAIFSGGTGLSKTDLTVETLKPLFSRTIDGFGEIFRWLSYREIGASAILSKAIAGVIGETIIYCIPGSPEGALLALRSLIIPASPHAIREVRRE